MTIEEADTLLRKYVTSSKMLNHCYASEAVMRGLAKRLGRDVEKWALAGLLHDIDIEVTGGDPKTHALEAVGILREAGLDEEIIDAVKMHNDYATGLPRTTEFQHALAAGETITGLIYATALVYPDKKIASVKPKSVLKRMKQPAFAASVKREHIYECEEIGIPVGEFVTIALTEMQKIGAKIGL